MYHPIESVTHPRNYNISAYAAPGIKASLMPETPITAARIIDAVAFYTQVPYDTMKKKTRQRGPVVARQLCMYFLKRHTTMSLKDIGAMFGGRDHTTAIHSIVTIKNLLAAGDASITAAVEHINAVL